MDNLDKYIMNIVNKKIKEPISYEKRIQNALNSYNKKNNFKKLVKKIIAIITGISAIGGIVLAVKLSGIFKTDIDKNYAVNNNEYIQSLDIKYQTLENLSIKPNSILVDDFNIQLGIDYNYNEPITSAESKILIKDEKDNIIFKQVEITDENNSFKKLNRNEFVNNKSSSNEDIIEENNTSNLDNVEQQDTFSKRYTSDYKNINDKSINRKLVLYSDTDFSKFPYSKKLYLQLEDVILKNGDKKVKLIKGKWIFEINLDEKYTSKRKTEIYMQTKNNLSDYNLKITKAELSNVQLIIKLESKDNQKIDTILEKVDIENILILNEKDNCYIKPDYAETTDKIAYLTYNVNRDVFKDIIKGKIKRDGGFELKKNK